jgi:aryl-alcohol dehydrogenase-like predicted oxidoreductase
VERNLALVDALRKIADSKGVTVAQLAVAWVAAQGTDIVPLVGARTRTRLTESLGAVEIELSAADLAEIDAAVPAGSAAGARYAYASELDSER